MISFSKFPDTMHARESTGGEYWLHHGPHHKNSLALYLQHARVSYFGLLNSADFLCVASMYLPSRYTGLRLSLQGGLPFPRQFRQRDHSQLVELQIQPFPDVCPLQVYLSRLFEKKRKERQPRVSVDAQWNIRIIWRSIIRTLDSL